MDLLGIKKVKPDMAFDVNKMIKDTRKVMDKLDVIDTRMDRYRNMRLKEIRSKIIAKECRNDKECDIKKVLKKYTIEFVDEDKQEIKELEEEYEMNEKNKKDDDFIKMIEDLGKNKELDELYEDIMKMKDNDEGKIQDLILKLKNQNSLEYELSKGLSVDESTEKST
jgi:adenylosuccinate lyase